MLPIQSLDSKPGYVALSYAWSELGSGFTPILVDGRTLDVSKSLEVALKHLRQPEWTITLWTDSICINQDDNEEKSSQVPLMREIYTTAAAVVVWLGQETDYSGLRWLDELSKHCIFKLDSNATFEQESTAYLSELLSHSGQNSSRNALRPMLINPFRRLFSRERQESGQSGFPLDSICNIFRRIWWKRVWCFQELQLAREAIMVLGELAIPYGMLATSYLVLEAFSFSQPQSPALADIARKIRSELLGRPTPIMRAASLPSPDLSLSQRLRPMVERVAATNGMKSSDPRDYVFALLGTVSDVIQVKHKVGHDHINEDGSEKRLQIVVSYELDWYVVWSNLMAELIRTDNSLKALAWCRHNTRSIETLPPCKACLDQPNPCRHDQRNRPSWVPDFSAPFPEVLSSFPGEKKQLFNASGGKGIPQSFRIDQKARTLTTRGFFIDTVVEVSPPQLVVPKRTGQILRNVHTLIERSPLVNPKDIWRIPICDKAFEFEPGATTTTSRRADARMQESYSDYFLCYKGNTPQEKILRLEEPYYKSLVLHAARRESFRTEKGYVGMGPEDAQNDDVVYVLPGADVPYLLRPRENGRFELVGQCYLHGIMDGEAVEGVAGDGLCLELV